MISEQELVNEFDSAGWTPLHKAAYYGDVEGAKALLTAGADHKLKDRRSYKDLTSGTPCEIARNNLMDIDQNGIDDGFYEWLDSKDHAAINYFKNSLQEIWRILANLDLKDSAEKRPVHEHE
ncbi:hypothetical protein DIS24_g6762 [Lasiodiplodia hormozganensis]|uniref:Ankyrin repeat domain-containing protein n=1 Tax=Lasiodiplodia hormozganensis TaxID=869390 RepID=A0AA39YDB3_9PEZI|nr:hypothetical protein DIS24_g6762 [Lasiodiplodia hormozganensis]